MTQVENLELDRSQDQPSELDRSEATLEPAEATLTDPETIQESIEEGPIAEAVWALGEESPVAAATALPDADPPLSEPVMDPVDESPPTPYEPAPPPSSDAIAPEAVEESPIAEATWALGDESQASASSPNLDTKVSTPETLVSPVDESPATPGEPALPPASAAIEESPIAEATWALGDDSQTEPSTPTIDADVSVPEAAAAPVDESAATPDEPAQLLTSDAIVPEAVEESPIAEAVWALGDESQADFSTPGIDAEVTPPEAVVAPVDESPATPDEPAPPPIADAMMPEANDAVVGLDSNNEGLAALAIAGPRAEAAVEPPVAEPQTLQTPEERVANLEAEVNAAPHKVYSLGKVRRVLAEFKTAEAAEELTSRLDGLETGILAQIAERKTAKESICEQAEALQDSNEWRVTGDKLRGLFEQWKLIGGAGKKLDDELWQRFISAREHFSKRRTVHFEERQQVWAVAKEKKEALIAQAEAHGSSTEWRSTADKIRNLQDQWKEAGSAGREADDGLWNRFNAAKQAFFDNRTSIWDANKQQKEALCLEAEALKESSDWRLTGDAMKAMQARWKEIGSAGKAAEDKLWERFRAATNSFFERREGAFAGKRQEERENLTKKQDLVTKIEALVYISDGLSAAREARDLQAQWKAVGHASREQADALWTRFRSACDKIFESASSERDRQQTEWHGRMKEAMTRKREQLSSTRESIEHDEVNLERWRATLSEIRPGGNTRGVEADLDSKILDVINRIRTKNERVEELRATIADMEAKLRD